MVALAARSVTEELIISQSRMAWSIANRLHPEPPLTSEDLVQTGLMMLTRRMAQFNADAYDPKRGSFETWFSTWAFTVMRNSMLNECRNSSWRGDKAKIEGRDAEMLSFDSDTDSGYEAEKGVDRFWEGTLDAREKFVVLATDAGYTTTEIASMLKLPRAAVLQISATAAEKLRIS